MQRRKLKHRLGDNSGVVKCNISAFKGSYSLELGVVDNLFADVILGLDFLKMHRSTTLLPEVLVS